MAARSILPQTHFAVKTLSLLEANAEAVAAVLGEPGK
jgi:hypothetical protein